jgi:hypothetical protein
LFSARTHDRNEVADALYQESDAGKEMLEAAQATAALARATDLPLSPRAQAQAECWLAFAYRRLKLREDADHHAMTAIRGAREAGDLAMKSGALLVDSLTKTANRCAPVRAVQRLRGT